MREEADVCLILEGTYPYVQGGVSSWVHQIITELPEIKFALVFMGSTKENCAQSKYELPANVIDLTEIFLFDPLPARERQRSKSRPKIKRQVYRKIEQFYLAGNDDDRAARLWPALDALENSGITFGDLCADKEMWDLLLQIYLDFAPDESFTDFFWTARFVHMPLWKVVKSIPILPSAKLYHCISTGYAGFAGALVSRRHNVPYLITEHGIYTKERIAEISQADWIYDPSSKYLDLARGLGKIKQIWISYFLFLGKVSYHAADQIVSLYQGITQLQIEFGADPARLRVIPNGIDPFKFDRALKKRTERLLQAPARKTIGFIGRIVPIKDVKTLLRAAKLVVQKCPEAVFELIGPTDEDPGYFAECLEMVQLFGLEKHVNFRGSQNVREILSELDLVLLTSISEGLPLIILEAFSAGVPIVSTDVGACRELIFGRTMEDKAIGKGGLLTKICSPQETADAILKIIRDSNLLLGMGAAGRQRTERFYRQAEIMNLYRHLYTDHSWRRNKQPQLVAT